MDFTYPQISTQKNLESLSSNTFSVEDSENSRKKAWNPDLSYYQWTGLILVLQAGIFYLPKLLWQHKEKVKQKQFLRTPF